MKENFKALLCSYGFDSPVMWEKLRQVIPQNRELANKVCFCLPYAASNFEAAFRWDKKWLTAYGFMEDNIKLIKSKEDITAIKPDYIYVSGGDPFLLLKTINGLGIRQQIIDLCLAGAVYIGVSAGADITAESIEYVMQLEDNNVLENDFTALNLVKDYCILCHYDRRSYLHKLSCENVAKKEALTINEDGLLLCENGKWQYIGE